MSDKPKFSNEIKISNDSKEVTINHLLNKIKKYYDSIYFSYSDLFY